MKFQTLRNSLIGSALALLAAVVLGSCGGGGAGSVPAGSLMAILPATGTMYSGVQYTISVTGGRPPYTLGSSEPVLFSVPQTLDGHTFSVIPANTGVIDIGQEPGQLPTREVSVTARDSLGNAATAVFDIAMNFMTGYNIAMSSNCPAPATGLPPPACAGGETIVQLDAIINGLNTPLRTYRLDILRGPIYWVFPTGQIAGESITITTDHQGNANAILRVNANVPTQTAAFRVTDLATGASIEHVFFIDGTDIGAELTAIPDEFTFTGPFTTTCGTGSATFLVFDGTPPYTVVSSFPGVAVSPTTSDSQPGQFTFTVGDASTCLSGATIVIRDANNAFTTVEINTETGSGDPPPAPLSVTPTGLTLDCGTSGSVSAVGGGATISASSPDPRLSVVVAGRTVTVTRAGVDPETAPDIITNVTVTDGATTANIRVTHPTGCS